MFLKLLKYLPKPLVLKYLNHLKNRYIKCDELWWEAEKKDDYWDKNNISSKRILLALDIHKICGWYDINFKQYLCSHKKVELIFEYPPDNHKQYKCLNCDKIIDEYE